MKLTQLRYFQTICKFNNITRASNELHVSQPSLSNTIKELEDEFGVSLFYRLSKGMRLTEEGEYFLHEATRLLEQSDALVSHMHTLGKTKHNVKIGVPPMLSSLIFPRLLKSCQTNFSNTKLKMIEHGTLTNRILVLDGTIDAAVISCIGSLPLSFGYCDLCSLDIFFYVSIDNPLAAQSSISLSSLWKTPLAMLAEDSFLTSYINQRYKALNLTPNIIVNTNQIATIQQLVDNNTAAALLFDNILDTDKNIVKLPVNDLPTIQIRLIWNSNRKLSAGTQNLIRLSSVAFSQPDAL